jgi:DNA polymerase-3 subunit gamma/tau
MKGMSYQVLARKWRPRNFGALVGQEHVVRALRHALEHQRLHHAYLLTGTRGVGKTTLARILAKCLNCETGITAEPCGKCSACEEIDGGRYVDLLEVDAATNTRVDEMRQLLDTAQYAPTRGRFKVYVIDEVHMLSNSAFNAMLKTLEEPPEHLKFILATTDPQKIPVTVLSRCLQFNLKQMPPGAIAAHLARLLEAEGVPCQPEALQLIGRAAAGSMRDALSLLDQAIAHGAGSVTVEGARDMLGAVDEGYLLRLLEAVAAADGPRVLSIADEMQAHSLSFDAALRDVAHLLLQVAIVQVASGALEAEAPHRQELVALAQRVDPEHVQLCYQMALQGREDLALAPDEHSGFVMTMLRMLAFRPDLPRSEGKGAQARDSTPRRARRARHPRGHRRGSTATGPRW